MAETRSHSSSSKWACLHRDVIDSILDRLVLVSDLIRFRAVCKSWNCLCLNYYKEKRILAINHQLPWLVIQATNKVSKTHNLYDLTSSKIIDFPFDHGLYYPKSHYYGSSHGWLFFNITPETLIMLNPVSETIFTLPPLIINTPRMVGMVALSRDPSSCLKSPFEVLVSFSNMSTLDEMAHWNSGDEFFTYYESSSSSYSKEDGHYCRFHNFIFYKDGMLGISSVCSRFTRTLPDVVDVITINIDNSQAPLGGGRIKIKKMASIPTLEDFQCIEGYSIEGYLIETTKGELLMVLGYIYTNMTYDLLKTFRIYKVIVCSNDSSAKIIPIINLDGESLFLTKFSQGISVLASNYPACMAPNSIYYATFIDDSGDRKIEVFHVEGGSFSYCLLPRGYKKLTFSQWIVPSMKL